MGFGRIPGEKLGGGERSRQPPIDMESFSNRPTGKNSCALKMGGRVNEEEEGRPCATIRLSQSVPLLRKRHLIKNRSEPATPNFAAAKTRAYEAAVCTRAADIKYGHRFSSPGSDLHSGRLRHQNFTKRSRGIRGVTFSLMRNVNNLRREYSLLTFGKGSKKKASRTVSS